MALSQRESVAEGRAVAFNALSQLVTQLWAPYAASVLQRTVSAVSADDDEQSISYLARLQGASEEAQSRAVNSLHVFAAALQEAVESNPAASFPPLAISSILFWVRAFAADNANSLETFRKARIARFLQTLMAPPPLTRSQVSSPTDLVLHSMQSALANLAAAGLSALTIKCSIPVALPASGRKVVRSLARYIVTAFNSPIPQESANMLLDALVVLLSSTSGEDALKEFREASALLELFSAVDYCLGEHNALSLDLMIQLLKLVRPSVLTSVFV